MIGDVFKALMQVSDPKFLNVFIRGVAMTVLLLVSSIMALLWALPNSISVPWFGELVWLTPLLDGFAVISMIGLSIILMIPVATICIGLFLDRILDAVEAKHYPDARLVRNVGIRETIIDLLSFLSLFIVINLLALVFYPFLPFVFWIVNGVLLGREYFHMVAIRHVGRKEAKALRRNHGLKISIAGTLLAMPLTLPLLNLVIPIFGAAMFTHLFHRLAAK